MTSLATLRPASRRSRDSHLRGIITTYKIVFYQFELVPKVTNFESLRRALTLGTFRVRLQRLVKYL
jgi:hypothetical protein